MVTVGPCRPQTSNTVEPRMAAGGHCGTQDCSRTLQSSAWQQKDLAGLRKATVGLYGAQNWQQ